MDDARLTIPMDRELRDWVHAQAVADDRSDCAWARTLFNRIRRGEGVAGLRLPKAPQLQPNEPATSVLRMEGIPEEDISRETQEIDTDALVANALETADIQPPPQMIEQPQGSVRSLRRPASALAAGNHSHIEKFLGR